MRICRGCGIEFEPAWHRQFYHTPKCREDSHNLRNRDAMKRRRGSPIGRVNLGGLMDLIDKDGPIRMRRNGTTYIFSTITRNGKVQVPA
jgi:hypothetical protein